MVIIKKIKKTIWNNKEYTSYHYTIISKKHHIDYEFTENKTFKQVIKWHMVEKNMVPIF